MMNELKKRENEQKKKGEKMSFRTFSSSFFGTYTHTQSERGCGI
jgi:hypothetical protein